MRSRADGLAAALTAIAEHAAANPPQKMSEAVTCDALAYVLRSVWIVKVVALIITVVCECQALKRRC